MHELVSAETEDMRAEGLEVHFNGTQAVGRARLLATGWHCAASSPMSWRTPSNTAIRRR